jgi:hypothetical protein
MLPRSPASRRYVDLDHFAMKQCLHVRSLLSEVRQAEDSRSVQVTSDLSDFIRGSKASPSSHRSERTGVSRSYPHAGDPR